MSDLLVVALLFQMILWQASFVGVAIDTTQVAGQRILSDSNSTHYIQFFLNEHLYKTDSSVKLVPAFLYSLLFDFIRRTLRALSIRQKFRFEISEVSHAQS